MYTFNLYRILQEKIKLTQQSAHYIEVVGNIVKMYMNDNYSYKSVLIAQYHIQPGDFVEIIPPLTKQWKEGV